MKRVFVLGLAAITASGSVWAQTSVEAVRAQLSAEGYSNIEVKTRGTTIKVEGKRAGKERELVFDANTFELLKDETNAHLEADDDDDDDKSRSRKGRSDNDQHRSKKDHRDHDDDDHDDDDDDDDDEDDDRDDDDDDDDDDEKDDD